MFFIYAKIEVSLVTYIINSFVLEIGCIILGSITVSTKYQDYGHE